MSSIVVDKAERFYAVAVLNAAIPDFNRRETRSEGLDMPEGPIGGVHFMCSCDTYEVVFRDLRTNRVYGIVAPRYDPYVTKPLWSMRRQALDPVLVKRVERLLYAEDERDVRPIH